MSPSPEEDAMSAQTAESVTTSTDQVLIVEKGTELARILANVLPSAGKDDTLPILTAVHVDVTADRITVAATDRYTLATDYIERAKDEAEWPTMTLNIARADVARIGKLLTGVEKRSPLTITASAHGRVTVANWTASIGFQLVEGEFPRYQKLFWEGEGEATSRIAFNPAQFARFAKIASDGYACKAPLPIELAFNDRKPVLITTPGYPSFRGLVMPVRMS